MAIQGPTRTITLTFETEEQARRFDEAMECQTALVPKVAEGVQPGDDHLDLAINARPFSGAGDPDAFPAKVEVVW